MLTCGNDQRRSVPESGENSAEGMTETSRRMQIDKRGVTRRLSKAVCHTNNAAFLKSEDISEILWEIAKHRQLG